MEMDDKLEAQLKCSAELARQHNKWGEQNHPDLNSTMLNSTYEQVCKGPLGIPLADQAKIMCDSHFKNGTGCWAHILLEEFCEAVEQAHAQNEEELYDELVQVAAVSLQWAAAIRRRQRNG